MTAILFFGLINNLFSQTMMVSTLAGNSASGSTNATGVAASFNLPTSVAIDASGNVFVADHLNLKIRKITPAGVVTTFAGSGVAGSTNATGILASFNYPTGIAIDGAGNLFVADAQNCKIRKITTIGVVTTFAGSGALGSVNATGINASFKYPSGVAVDASGNVFVADNGNHLIRKITSAGVVTTLAGSGVAGSTDAAGLSASFNFPTSVAVNGLGKVFVADRSNNKIRIITVAGGVVTTLAGSGVAGSVDATGGAASFWDPSGVTTDASGNVFVADRSNHKIRKITATGVVTTFAGSGAFGSVNGLANVATFYLPVGVAVDAAGVVYVAGGDDNQIRKISPCILSTTTSATACNSYTWTCNSATYTASGNYTCSSLNTNGCTNVNTLALTINASINTSTTGTGCNSYNWACNNMTYTSNGNYTCTTLNSNGCTNTNSLNVNLCNSLPVTGLNVTAITGLSATINWTPVACATWYQLRYRTTNPVGAYTTVSINAPASSKGIVGLTYNTNYEYQVRSFCSASLSGPWSNTMNFSTNSSCNIPVGLAISGNTPTSATASWTPVVGATSYVGRYKLSTSSSWTNSFTSTPTTKLLSGLLSNTTYDMQIAVVCGSVTSPYSSTVSFITLPCSIPTGLSVTNFSNTTPFYQCQLNWTAITGITNYYVRYRVITSPPGWTTSFTNTNNKVIFGLTPGQQWEFQVAAYCGSSFIGTYSPSTMWTNPTTIPPSANNMVSTIMDEENGLINIYPNPISDILYIDLTTISASPVTLKISDMTGRLIKQVHFNATKELNSNSINFSDLPKGIFTLQVFENGIVTHVRKIEHN